MTLTLTGSSPLKGSSSTNTSGSGRMVPMNWNFCCIPLLSSSTLASARSAKPHALQPLVGPPARGRVVDALEPARYMTWSRVRIFLYRPRSSGR